MAFSDYDEYEQSEKVRQWIKENGLAVVVGVVVALALIFGWRQWKAHTESHHMQAAGVYATLSDALAAGNEAAADSAFGELKKDFDDTPYAAFGAAAMAGDEVGRDKLDQAARNLQWAVDHSPEPALRRLFTLRLARVELAQGNARQALTHLEGMPAGDYPALVDELRGDALLKLGQLEAARGAYQAALAALDKDAPQREALKMKLDDLTQPGVAQPGKQGT